MPLAEVYQFRADNHQESEYNARVFDSLEFSEIPMSDQYPMDDVEQANATADAWAAVAAVSVLVLTVTFWLVGK